MKLRVNNVKIFLDRELPLQKALSKKLGVAEEDIQNFCRAAQGCGRA